MAPPTRLRPHLNDLLQKNLELEHVVADLRHQLTQSSAKWADERKMLAVGCDSLMASFAKFRARLDVHSSDVADSEGEVEQNLDVGGQSFEETGEADNGMLEADGDHGSVVVNLRERCHTLAAELQVKEDELEESRKKQEATEEQLQRLQRSLEARSEQLREALVSAGTDTIDKLSPERTADDVQAQTSQGNTGLEDTREKLDLANQELNRFRKLLIQWQTYGNEWKRDAQASRTREAELIAKLKVAEDNKVLLESQRKENQLLTSALADQAAAAEKHRTACQESAKRVQDLEAMVALLRARLSPDQLASFDSELSEAVPERSNSTQPPTVITIDAATQDPPNLRQSPAPRADTNSNKRSEMIMLKIPYRSIRKSPGENNGTQDEQQEQPTETPISAPPRIKTPLNFNTTDFELCIHTCNPHPCRNEAQSFLWPRKMASLPRHAISAKKHRRCTPGCPGHRLLTMLSADALKEPRKVKCRPPSEAEVAQATEEAKKVLRIDPTEEQRTGVEEAVSREGSVEPDEPEDADEVSAQEEDGAQEKEEERSPRKTGTKLGKRLRSRPTDSDESPRTRKLRPRLSMNGKP